MRRAFFAATAFISFASIGQSSLAAEAPYVDDRSDAAAVVNSLYSAINRHEFARAWDYFGDTKPAKDFDTFVKGYDGTEQVEVKTGSASVEGAAGSTFFNLPVAIKATAKDGSEKVFAGCYTLRQVNAQIQEPPFRPIFIDKGALKPTTADFEEAVPTSCGDGPPPPKKDAALEQARKAFAAAYGCAAATLAANAHAVQSQELDRILRLGRAGLEPWATFLRRGVDQQARAELAWLEANAANLV